MHEARQAARPVVVRTPDPPLARPRAFLREAWRDLGRSRPLAVQLAKRDIRSQYRQTLAGAAVVVLPPVVMTAVALGFERAGILSVGSLAVPYGLFVFLGVILWLTFIDALNAPVHGLLAERRLLARMGSPPEAVVVGKLLQVLFNLGIRLALLIVAIAWYGASVPLTVVLAPFGIIGLLALGTALGLVLAPLNLIYRDVSRLLLTVTTFWLFFSPVYFPAPGTSAMGTIMRLNPVTPLISGTRALALTGERSDPVAGLLAAVGTLILLALGWVYVRVALPVALEQASE
jgi:lipopolysaccharide transport system permease protein